MLTLRNRLLIVFFAALFFLNVSYIVLGFASIPLYYERVTNQTIETYSNIGVDLVSNDMAQQEAAKRGFTLGQYAIEQILFSSGVVLLSCVVAGLVVWRA